MEKIDKKILNDFNIFDETIVVGCSTGPDSMALFCLLFLISRFWDKGVTDS